MTSLLYLDDAYCREAPATVQGKSGADMIWLDRTIFYATSGGQPHDTGTIRWKAGTVDIINASKGSEGRLLLHASGDAGLPEPGEDLIQEINWDRRYRFMRIHTALHLLSVVVPLPVTGGSISEQKGRLDFNMPEAVTNKAELEERINELVGRNLQVTYEWISDEELSCRPEMVKTMSVKPPMGAGRVRLVRIGDNDETVDLQPCGGTHVRSTGEIGRIRLGKIEKKGRMNRRINITVD